MYVTILSNNFLQSSRQRAVKAKSRPMLTTIRGIMNGWCVTFESPKTLSSAKNNYINIILLQSYAPKERKK